ncbi:hypothetical protein RND71_031525 [Anisodus tanguticus]|uniref:Transmembrane protein n=1 Tax=Anisodus tanguticus TaxID=243964 RepID=A0AAE1RAW9_9SOLA|nr:hypothetical protein RND71_031525 [Anisodus tanguticus]
MFSHYYFPYKSHTYIFHSKKHHQNLALISNSFTALTSFLVVLLVLLFLHLTFIMFSNSMVPKNDFSQRDKKVSNICSHVNDEDDIIEEDEDNQSSRDQVTSHIYLKPTNSTGPMNKDAVLSRIRHRKQVNKFKAATQSFLGFPFRTSTKNDTNNKIVPNFQIIRWVDDAFAAP